jgi:FMN reductase
MTFRMVAISAGMSDPSTTRMLADRITDAVQANLPEATVETVSLRELAHDITDATLAGFASPRLQHVLDAVMAADGLIAVTPIFKASYTGLFKSFFDVLGADALIGKPVIVAATGGTARHSLAIDFAMRPLFAYMQALVVPTGIFASPHDWGTEGKDTLAGRIDRAAAELASILAGAGTGRQRDEEFDMFSDSMLAAARP